MRHFVSNQGTGAEILLRDCFWDCYLGGASQLLANFFSLSPVTAPEVFAKVNSFQFRYCSTL